MRSVARESAGVGWIENVSTAPDAVEHTFEVDDPVDFVLQVGIGGEECSVFRVGFEITENGPLEGIGLSEEIDCVMIQAIGPPCFPFTHGSESPETACFLFFFLEKAFRPFVEHCAGLVDTDDFEFACLAVFRLCSVNIAN